MTQKPNPYVLGATTVAIDREGGTIEAHVVLEPVGRVVMGLEAKLMRENDELREKLEAWEAKGERLKRSAIEIQRRADLLEQAFAEELEVLKRRHYREAWDIVTDHTDPHDEARETIQRALGILEDP